MKLHNLVTVLIGAISSSLAVAQHSDIHNVTTAQLNAALANYKTGEFAKRPLVLVEDRDYWLTPNSRWLIVTYVRHPKTKQEVTIVDYYGFDPKTFRVAHETFDDRGLKNVHLYGDGTEMIIKRDAHGSYLCDRGPNRKFIPFKKELAGYLGHSIIAPPHP